MSRGIKKTETEPVGMRQQNQNNYGLLDQVQVQDLNQAPKRVKKIR